MKSKIAGCTHHASKVIKMAGGGSVPKGVYRAKMNEDGVQQYVRKDLSEDDMRKSERLAYDQYGEKAAFQLARARGRNNAKKFLDGVDKDIAMRSRTGGK